MASVVAYNPKTKTWYARPSTVAKTTTVVFVGPASVPNPPAFVDGVDLRQIGESGPPTPATPPASASYLTGYTTGYGA